MEKGWRWLVGPESEMRWGDGESAYGGRTHLGPGMGMRVGKRLETEGKQLCRRQEETMGEWSGVAEEE